MSDTRVMATDRKVAVSYILLWVTDTSYGYWLKGNSEVNFHEWHTCYGYWQEGNSEVNFHMSDRHELQLLTER